MAEIQPSTGARPGLRVGRRSTDQRLARLASHGSARAFALLYERHHQALYRYCLAIVRAPEDAQDALQSTFMHAFAALRGRKYDRLPRTAPCHAQSLCAAQGLGESQILNANPLCKNFRQTM